MLAPGVIPQHIVVGGDFVRIARVVSAFEIVAEIDEYFSRGVAESAYVVYAVVRIYITRKQLAVQLYRIAVIFEHAVTADLIEHAFVTVHLRKKAKSVEVFLLLSLFETCGKY